MTTLEGNKLIAEFMGDKNTEVVDDVLWTTNSNNSNYSIKVEYHASWDWLMPVVEKIEDFGFRFYIERGGGTMHYCKIKEGKKLVADEYSQNSKISSVYEAVTQFIQWYNKQNTPAKVDDKKGDY